MSQARVQAYETAGYVQQRGEVEDPGAWASGKRWFGAKFIMGTHTWNNMNVVVVTESMTAFLVGVRSIVCVRITQKQNHPLLWFRIRFKTKNVFVCFPPSHKLLGKYSGTVSHWLPSCGI